MNLKKEVIEVEMKKCNDVCASPVGCNGCPIFPHGKRYDDIELVNGMDNENIKTTEYK